jgi:hypothetical protein
MVDYLVPEYLLSEVVPYLALGGGAYLAWRLVRALERLAATPRRLRALHERVRLLEAAVERMEGSVTRTAEAQRLAATLLTTHAALHSPAPSPPRVPAP